MAEWYYQTTGETVGPLSAKEIKAHAAQGRIPTEAFVRQGTDGKWLPIKCVRGLEVNEAVAAPPTISNPTDPTRSPIQLSEKKLWYVAFGNFIRRAWPVPTLIISLLVWICSANSFHGKSGFWSYPAMTIAAASVAALLAKRFPGKFVFPCVAIVTLALLIYWGRTDTYTETWVNGKIQYSDQYNRWSRRHVYRSMLCFKSEEKARTNPFFLYAESAAEGPMQGTGKPHGLWKFTTYFWDVEPIQLPKTDNRFFWYDEEISEGEWHIRNR